MFQRTLGHEAIKRYLQNALLSKTLPHALFFAGPDGIGKRLLAKELAAAILQVPFSLIDQALHPDFHFLKPEGKSGLYAIETIRSTMEKIYLAPFSAPSKVFVFDDAERMQPAVANALLKTVEEPPLHTILIFISSAPNEVIPTLLSRTSFLRFYPSVDKKALELQEEIVKIFAKPLSYIERSKLFEALEKKFDIEDGIQKEKQIDQLFTSLVLWFRDQVVRSLNIASSHLFFPNIPAMQKEIDHRKVMAAIEDAKLGLARNMKLSVCLERVYQGTL